MVQSDDFCTLKLSENRISTIWDSFHDGASPSYDIFYNVTDGQNANTELITVIWRYCIKISGGGGGCCRVVVSDTF